MSLGSCFWKSFLLFPDQSYANDMNIDLFKLKVNMKLFSQFMQDTHVVLIPCNSNFATIDAITVEIEGDKRIIYIWQVTIQSPNDHGLVKSGLDIVKRCCDAAEIRLVWVLNNIDGAISHLTRPEIKDSTKFVPDFDLGITQYIAFLHENELHLTTVDTIDDTALPVPPEPIVVPVVVPVNAQPIVPTDTSPNIQLRRVSPRLSKNIQRNSKYMAEIYLTRTDSPLYVSSHVCFLSFVLVALLVHSTALGPFG